MIDHLALLEGEVAAMTAVLRAADPHAPVASCPGWTVTDLAVHLSATHLWALAALDSSTAPPYAETPLVGELASAYGRAAGGLVEGLRDRSPDAPAWSLSRADRTAGFWRRRQLHEVAVHRWDVEPYELDEALAADGVDEVLGMFLPRQVATGRTTLPVGRLQLVSAHQTWEVGTDGPVTRVDGTASVLLLSLWRRRTRDLGTWDTVAFTP